MALKEFRINTQSIINRKEEAIASYLKDISKYDILSVEEEVELTRQIREGGKKAEKAKNRLVEANLRFVVSVANSYNIKSMELADLIEEGNAGLIKAAEHYDETQGFKFISYAVWWIRNAILNAINEHSHIIHMPQNQQKILAAFSAMQREVQQKENRLFTVDEFCDITGNSPQNVQHLLAISSNVIDMDAPIKNDEDCDKTIGDNMSSASRTDALLDKESLHDEVVMTINAALTERERKVVDLYLGINGKQLPLEVIATEIGLCRERTRQVFKDAIAKIRRSPYSKVLRKYLAA